jgi:Zn-dependent peptidase ImmA (M78 family)
MTLRAEVNPVLLVWARERAGLEVEDLVGRFPKLPEWEQGERHPTFKQLESYARATHAPIGFLLLESPPDEPLPIPDYRTMEGGAVARPSADLLDTIFQTEQRRDWYREYAESEGLDRLPFVGSLALTTDVVEAAETMRRALDFEVNERGSTVQEARRLLIEHAEALGILVMVNGVVGSNTHRPLDPAEFRGFALVDPWAPVVFVNGADTLNAQMFTLAHELAHVWLGEPGLSDVTPRSRPSFRIERWCNAVAAELLVPLESLRREYRPQQPLVDELERLARRFRVSTLVILRRIADAEYIDRDTFFRAYEEERDRILQILSEQERGSGQGNFFNTQPLRVSKRFARALIASTLEGETLRRDALQMLGFKKLSTLEELASRLGVN